jgi:hypothetical protein
MHPWGHPGQAPSYSSFWAPPPPPWSYYPPPANAPPQHGLSAGTPLASLTSSPPDIQDPTIYPSVIEWFADLEKSPRADGQLFAQYGTILHQEGYRRIYQLHGLSVKELKDMCSDLLDGDARLILAFVKSDCRKICR